MGLLQRQHAQGGGFEIDLERVAPGQGRGGFVSRWCGHGEVSLMPRIIPACLGRAPDPMLAYGLQGILYTRQDA